jgi:hypothetical protein
MVLLSISKTELTGSCPTLSATQCYAFKPILVCFYPYFPLAIENISKKKKKAIFKDHSVFLTWSYLLIVPSLSSILISLYWCLPSPYSYLKNINSHLSLPADNLCFGTDGLVTFLYSCAFKSDFATSALLTLLVC